MKTRLVLLMAVTALLFTAVPPQLAAADVSVDISSFAARDAKAILAQIELNVRLKQYEKLLTQMETMSLEHELEMESVAEDSTNEQQKQAKDRSEKRQSEFEHKDKCLKIKAHECRARIVALMVDANKRAEAFEKEQREAKETTGQNQPNGGTLKLSRWSDEIGREVMVQILKGWRTESESSHVIGGSLVPEVVSFAEFLDSGTPNLTGPNQATTPPKAPAHVQPASAK